jgi:hypothetical protein
MNNENEHQVFSFRQMKEEEKEVEKSFLLSSFRLEKIIIIITFTITRPINDGEKKEFCFLCSGGFGFIEV